MFFPWVDWPPTLDKICPSVDPLPCSTVPGYRPALGLLLGVVVISFISRAFVICICLTLTSCANHPIDCAMGIHHSDCLPDTAGYDDPNKFADTDDKLCQSYGLKFGTSEYADCRVRLTS
jgi:hypothetical protein